MDLSASDESFGEDDFTFGQAGEPVHDVSLANMFDEMVDCEEAATVPPSLVSGDGSLATSNEQYVMDDTSNDITMDQDMFDEILEGENAAINEPVNVSN